MSFMLQEGKRRLREATQDHTPSWRGACISGLPPRTLNPLPRSPTPGAVLEASHISMPLVLMTRQAGLLAPLFGRGN